MLLVEIGLRFYLNESASIEPVECKREDPIVHHGYKPITTCRYKTAEWDTEIRINSHGLRNKEIEESKNKFRVLVMGDSFTAAESVDYEKTFVYLAESTLIKEGKNIEVINAGVPSYSPILEYLWLREYGLELNPDLVILNFDLGDVSGDNFMMDYYSGFEKSYDDNSSLENKESGLDSKEVSDEKSPLIVKEEPIKLWADTRRKLFISRAENPDSLTLITRIKFWLHTHFKSYGFFAEATKKTIRKIRGIPEKPIYVLGDVKNDFEYVTRSIENAINREVYKSSLENLKRIKSLLDNNSIPFVVVYFPHGHQISGDEWAKGRQFYGLEQGKVYPLDSINVLMELSKEAEIETYDATESFLKASDSLFPLFYPFDGHFTANGNMVMSGVLAEIIRKKRNAS